MVQPELRFTRADLDLIPEELRVELIDGQILKMTFPTVEHQEIARRVVFALAREIGEERVLFGPVAFTIDDYNSLGPDVVAFAEGEAPGPAAKDLSRAALIVEVLSPSTASRDRQVKSALYLGAGVGEVWLIDARKRTVEIRTSRSGRVIGAGETAVSEALPGFSLRVGDLFVSRQSRQ